MPNAAETGSASNVVEMPRRPSFDLRKFKPVPHVITFRAGRMSIESDVDGLWLKARPLIGGLLASTRRTTDEIRAAVDALHVLPLMLIDDDGLMSAVVLINEGDLPDGSKAIYAAIQPDGNWPDLAQALIFLEGIAEQQRATCLILWSPDPLPPLDGWKPIHIPDVNPERGLMLTLADDGGE